VGQITSRICKPVLFKRCDHGGGFHWTEICHDALDIFWICSRRLNCRPTILRSHSVSDNNVARTAMMPQEMQHDTDSSKLPVEVADDRSVIYPQQPSR
jgi:hypothetical protein